MSSSTAEIKWESKDEAVIKSLSKLDRNLDIMARKLHGIEKASQKAAKATENGFEAATAKVAGFVTAFAGVGSVMAAAQMAANQLKSEWENLKNQQKSAADANLSLAKVLPGAVRAAGGFLSPREVEDQIRRVSENTLSGQVAAAQAITEGLTARAPQSRKEVTEAIRTVEATMKFAPEADSETLAAMAGGAVDLQKRYRVTPEQAVGFFEVAGGVGRVSKIRDQAQNMVPAIGGLTNFGATPAEAAALFGTITLDTGDFSGASAKTASISLAKALSDRGYADPMSGIKAIQNDPALRKAFLYGGQFNGQKFGKAPIEAATFPTIQALLTAGSQQAQMLEGGVPKVGDWGDAKAAFDRTSALSSQTQSGLLAKVQKVFSSSAESLRIMDQIGAEGAITREGFSELLDASGAGSLEKTFLSGEFDLATGGGTRTRLGDVAQRLRKRADFITRTEDYGSAGVGAPGVITPRKVSPEDEARGSVLDRVAKLLEDIARETRANRESTERQEKSGPRTRELPAQGFNAIR